MKLLTDPDYATRLHGWLSILWFAAAFPICILLSESVAFLVFVSVYAVVVSHWSSWQAARVEKLQCEADKRLEEDHQRLRKLDPDHPAESVETNLNAPTS